MEMPALPEGIEDARLRRLAAYWDDRRAGRAMPTRADIDPIEMPYILGNIALVEIRRDGPRPAFRFRLFGVNLVQDMGFDPTGESLDDYRRPEMRELLRASYTEVAEANRPFRRRRHGYVMDGRLFENESLLLPLGRDGRSADMLLVAVIMREWGPDGPR
jgi:hypothetical protein